MTIGDTGHAQNLLGGFGGDQTRTPWGRDQSDSTRTTGTSELARNGMGLTDLIHVISSSHGNDVEFGINDGTLDSTLDILGSFDTESDVTVTIADDDKGLETGSLT